MKGGDQNLLTIYGQQLNKKTKVSNNHAIYIYFLYCNNCNTISGCMFLRVHALRPTDFIHVVMLFAKQASASIFTSREIINSFRISFKMISESIIHGCLSFLGYMT